jgi:hypothetical protein
MHDRRPVPPPLPGKDGGEHPFPEQPNLYVVLIAVGVFLMLLVAGRESAWLSKQPWGNAVVVLNGEAASEDAIPVVARQVPTDNYPESELGALLKSNPETKELVESMKLDQGERLLKIDLPPTAFQPLLRSGRVPRPGAPEVLAGDLTQLESFVLYGETFTVVGHLARPVPLAVGAYVLPHDLKFEPYFSDPAVERGSLYIEGAEVLRQHFEGADDMAARMALAQHVFGGRSRTQPVYAWLVYAALVIVAVGGMGLAAWWCRFRAYSGGLFGPLYRACHDQPNFFFLIHAGLYGVLFVAMARGMAHPVLHLHLGSLVEGMFAEGSLSYIGEAYASGNIPQAAAATWWNNYVVQTVGLTFFASFGMWYAGMLPWLPSALLLWPLPIGLFKTVLSFALVGVVMAPAYSGIAGSYSFHSITMVLELEAYILACFVILAWPLNLLRAFAAPGRDWRPALAASMRLLGSGILFTGALLAVAGLYEAATLILLH